MSLPQSPPASASLLPKLPDLLAKAGGWESLTRFLPIQYLHWDELRHREPPKGLSSEEWWQIVKISRWGKAQPTPLEDPAGRNFSFAVPDPIPEMLHRIDQGAGGFAALSDPIASSSIRDRYILHGLIEEALRSSQVEGASATREAAKEMVRTGRDPRNLGERMV